MLPLLLCDQRDHLLIGAGGCAVVQINHPLHLIINIITIIYQISPIIKNRRKIFLRFLDLA